MSKFEEKKRLLAAESEVYRQLLKLEIQTYKVYGMRTKRRLTAIGTYLPWVLSGVPILSGLFRRKKRGSLLTRLSSLFLVGWKAYRQFAPLFGGKRFPVNTTHPSETAAEEYLAKRL